MQSRLLLTGVILASGWSAVITLMLTLVWPIAALGYILAALLAATAAEADTLIDNVQGYQVDKTDPFAFQTEVPPQHAAVVYESRYDFTDSAWLEEREDRNHQATLSGRRDAMVTKARDVLGCWKISATSCAGFRSPGSKSAAVSATKS